MKATLTKNIQLKTATAYLIFETEEERKDIVSFLNGNEFNDETINKRVKEYLKKIHLLDRDDTVTKKGEHVKKTSKQFVQEEGKYKIWHTKDDIFLKDKIIYFERKSPISEGQKRNERQKRSVRIEELNVNFKKENYFLPIKDKEEFSLLNLVSENIKGEFNGKTEPIQLVWNWNELEKSTFQFHGKINKNAIKKHTIESKENLNNYILNIFPDWDQTNNKLKIGFKNLNDNEKTKFILNYKNNNQAGFSSVEFSSIPIIPYNKQEAKQWRNWFVNQEIKENYFLEYDFEKLVKEINEKEGFTPYNDKLNIPNIIKYRDDIYNKDRSKQASSFWHLSAPNDLNPDADKKYIIKSFDYEIGKNISFESIVSDLVNNTDNKVNSIFYYDKYTNNYHQQKAMLAFFKSFDKIDDNNKCLITIKNLDGQKRSNYLSKNSKINVVDVNTLLDRKKTPHNRYIVLGDNKNKYTVWQLPSSIDYIKFNERDFNCNTIGKINDSMSFNQVKKEMLKPELRTYIENKL